MRSSATYTRDAALRKLARINRWLIAGSVALTAALSEAAAQAFPGKSTAAKSKGKSAGPQHHASQPSGGSLQPPAQAPSASGEAQHEPSSGSQSEPAPATPSESAPAQEPAPAQEAAPQESSHESAPSQESQAPAPAQESAPAQEAPVVSGGS